MCDPLVVPERDEEHLDRTNIAGLHAVFLTPKTPGGWRMGYLFTANRMSHPKIPNYQLQNIPRDPGNTDAFNLGFGTVARHGHIPRSGSTSSWNRCGVDTWADAAA